MISLFKLGSVCFDKVYIVLRRTAVLKRIIGTVLTTLFTMKSYLVSNRGQAEANLDSRL
jgi:hypothetical protein